VLAASALSGQPRRWGTTAAWSWPGTAGLLTAPPAAYRFGQGLNGRTPTF